MFRRRALAAAVVVLQSALVVFAGARARVTPYPPDWPHRAPWKLNRELLAPGTSKIVFVVDVVRGAPPKEAALDHLAAVASIHGEREALWVLAGDPGAPKVRWIVPDDPFDAPPLTVHLPAGQTVEQWQLARDDEDAIRIRLETIDCPAGPLSTQTSFVFVRYVGEWYRSYGSAGNLRPTASCAERVFPVIYVAQNTLRLHQMPGFPRDFLEPRDLAHEYGHVLGLASNPAHGWWARMLPFGGGAHCVNRECAVATPSAKALLKGKMLDYCKECRRDIDQARLHWSTGREFPESTRLAPPDPAEHVSLLKDYSFSPGGRADRLHRFGKSVVPALIERIPELPGGRETSPRRYAVGIVKQIIVTEDRKRRHDDDELSYVSPRQDRTQQLLLWWEQQGQAFMTGDDWRLPGEVLFVVPAEGPN